MRTGDHNISLPQVCLDSHETHRSIQIEEPSPVAKPYETNHAAPHMDLGRASHSKPPEIRDIAGEPQVFDVVFALNNAHAVELSWLDERRLRSMIGMAYYARAAWNGLAFLIAFDQDARYENSNFQWFRERLARFVYVDRIAVHPEARGLGLASALYRDVFALARGDGHDTVCCEVNSDPPNPVSDRFHDAFDFQAIGEAKIASGKTVRYLTRPLTKEATD